MEKRFVSQYYAMCFGNNFCLHAKEQKRAFTESVTLELQAKVTALVELVKDEYLVMLLFEVMCFKFGPVCC